MSELDYSQEIINEIEKIKNSLNGCENMEGLDKGIIGCEGIDGNEDEVKYLFFVCIKSEGSSFHLEDYINVRDNLDVDSRKVFIFKDREDETRQIEEYLKKIETSAEKRDFRDFFSRVTSLYLKKGEPLRFYVKDPENYLEYSISTKSDNGLKGVIYNLSLSELLNLYNVTGEALFDGNVRYGNIRGKYADDLKKSFERYIDVYLFNKLRNKIDEDELLKAIELDREKVDIYSPESFWFYHNGVTIFYKQGKLEEIDNYITISPSKASVINGAQTLTKFATIKHDLQSRLSKKLKDNGIEEKTIENYIEEASKKIFIKTIFLYGDDTYMKSVTNGLNTQLPILGEDILADSDDVKEINRCLKSKQIQILKEGENPSVNYPLDIIDFCKKYLIIRGYPGSSKNMQKSQMEKWIKEAKGYIEKNKEKSSKEFIKLIDLDEWWRNSRKNMKKVYEEQNNLVIHNYGKNYFQSYFLKKNHPDKYSDDTDYYCEMYDSFISDFNILRKELKEDFSLGDFKKNDLYKELEKICKESEKAYEKSKEKNSIEQIKGGLNELIDYLQKKSNYAYHHYIKKFYSDNGIELDYFRVINRINNKCKEAYPFPNSCFNELMEQNEDKDNEYKYECLKYEESLFYDEVNKECPVFIIDKKDDNSIIEIKYIDKFSYRKYHNYAKEVFEETRRAFKEGDEIIFPKIKDDKMFHVRPKAINSKDTFEFSNGDQITKRTFWANHSTVDNIIDELK